MILTVQIELWVFELDLITSLWNGQTLINGKFLEIVIVSRIKCNVL